MDELRMAQVSVERVHTRPPASSYALWAIGSVMLLASVSGTFSAAATVCDSTSCSVQSTLGMALGLLGMFTGAVLVAFGFAARTAHRRNVEQEHHRRLIRIGTEGSASEDELDTPVHYLD